MTISAWDLRQANLKRLPLFKNKNGEPAHSSTDGSDWTLAQWFQATAGEIGEFLEAVWGGSDKEMAHELADVQIYLDLLAYRLSAELSVGDRYIGLQGLVYCCTGVDRNLQGWGLFNLPGGSIPEVPRIIGERLGLKSVTSSPIDLMIIVAGHYANAKKKFDRGDTPKEQFVGQAEVLIGAWQLAICYVADEYSVDLESAVIEKFNLVSDRIGCEVKL